MARSREGQGRQLSRPGCKLRIQAVGLYQDAPPLPAHALTSPCWLAHTTASSTSPSRAEGSAATAAATDAMCSAADGAAACREEGAAADARTLAR